MALKESKQEIKKHKKTNVIVSIILGIAVVWIGISFFPLKAKEKHAFFENDRVLVMAHQGGNHLAPSSTLEAFEKAADLGVDIMELDIHMSKDGYLIPIHDPTIDSVTDGEGSVNEMTLEELQSYDAGAKFQDLNGEYSYKDKGVYLPTLEEVFDAIPHMRWNIEIKDTNDPALYEDIAKELWDVIVSYGLEEHVLLASFDHDIVELMKEASDGKAIVAAGKQEVTKFIVLQKLFLNGLYKPTVHAIEIPTKQGAVNLKDKKIIRGANKQGIDVHYWTINDVETMQELIDLGADGIITDRPDLLIELLGEKADEKR